MNRVDVMIPHYGDASYLKAAVRSVLVQDDPEWRLTVVDDSADDGLLEWFAGLVDDRVWYRRNERNLGLNANFQRCLDLAEHELVVIMGSDDMMMPNYVRTVRRAFDAYPNAALLQPGVRVIDEVGDTTRTLVDEVKKYVYAPKVTAPRIMGGEQLAISLLRGCWTYFPSLCWQRQSIEALRFREHLSFVLDLALLIDVLQRGGRMVVEPTVCFQYRRHGESESSREAITGSRFVEERDYFLRVAAEMEKQGWYRAARVARNHLSSRLHALTHLPTALRSRDRNSVRNLTRHVFGTIHSPTK